MDVGTVRECGDGHRTWREMRQSWDTEHMGIIRGCWDSLGTQPRDVEMVGEYWDSLGTGRGSRGRCSGYHRGDRVALGVAERCQGDRADLGV